MAAIKMASVVLSIPGCETFSCSAIAIMAAATMRTSSQERRYPSRNSQVVLGSGTRSEPATYRTRMYKKPGTYLNGLLLVDRRTALLASAPSEFVAISLPSLLRKKDRSPACLAVGCHGHQRHPSDPTGVALLCPRGLKSRTRRPIACFKLVGAICLFRRFP